MVRRLVLLLSLALAATPGPLFAANITIDAPPSLAPAARRIRAVDLDALAAALGRAGLELPPAIRITLIADDDPRARTVDRWIVGLAHGLHEVVIFPDRVLSYPYDSLESVVRHEIAHLALAARARSQPLPRWFHEGVAVSVDSGWGVSAQLRLLSEMMAGADTARLNSLFTTDSQSATQQAYLLSALLVEDVRRRHGAAAPGAIAGRMSASIPFATAFELETGELPDAAAARAWSGYRRWTAWIPAITSTTAAWAAILVLACAAYAAQLRRRWRRRQQWDAEGE